MNCIMILAGGVGSRMKSDVPKQYMQLCNMTVMEYCVSSCLACDGIDCLCLVVNKDSEYEKIRSVVETMIAASAVRLIYAEPGAERALSIYNGLKSLEGVLSDEDIVIVHDCARPLVGTELIKRLIKACEDHDGAMPYLPVTDTVYELDNEGRLCKNLDRSRIIAGQSPEAYRYKKYCDCYAGLTGEELKSVSGSTQLALVNGLDIVPVEGEKTNIKITTAEDLAACEELIAKGKV